MTEENHGLFPLSALRLESVVVNVSNLSAKKVGVDGDGEREKKRGRLFELRTKKRVKYIKSTASTISTDSISSNVASAPITMTTTNMSTTAASDGVGAAAVAAVPSTPNGPKADEEKVDEEVEVLCMPMEYEFARTRNEYEDLFVKKLIYFLLEMMMIKMDEANHENDNENMRI
jgi:hypothetical protein